MNEDSCIYFKWLSKLCKLCTHFFIVERYKIFWRSNNFFQTYEPHCVKMPYLAMLSFKPFLDHKDPINSSHVELAIHKQTNGRWNIPSLTEVINRKVTTTVNSEHCVVAVVSSTSIMSCPLNISSAQTFQMTSVEWMNSLRIAFSSPIHIVREHEEIRDLHRLPVPQRIIYTNCAHSSRSACIRQLRKCACSKTPEQSAMLSLLDTTLNQCCNRLKTHLFGSAYVTAYML